MHLAIFDLDNTLLAGDSDHLWGEFLVEQGLVDGPSYARDNQRYYEAYQAGTLDIHVFLRFALRPLREHDPELLRRQREQFLRERILPIIPPASRELLDCHRRRGDELLIITATNRFVTGPIAAELGVPHLLATEPEMIDGRYTGEVSGIPCFQAGKVARLVDWQTRSGQPFGERWFYSDSHNDLPLLRYVQHPVAVDPDGSLKQTAQAAGWPVVSLRGAASGADVFARVT